MNKNCRYCNKKFTTKKFAQQYCSFECQKENQKKIRKKYDNSEKAKLTLKAYQEKNKEKIKLYQKKYRQIPENKEKNRLTANNWLKSDKGKLYRSKYKKSEARKIASQKYKKSEKGKLADKRYLSSDNFRKYVREYTRKKRNTDIDYNLISKIRTQLNASLRKKNIKKTNKALELLGVEIRYFKKYLENKFKPGMTWDNQGKVWHLDHIIPVSIFDLSKQENIKFAFHYRNLQPMFAVENIKKSNKVFVSVEKGDKLRDVDAKIKNILKRVHPEQELDFNIITTPIDKRGRGVEIIFKRSIN